MLARSETNAVEARLVALVRRRCAATRCVSTRRIGLNSGLVWDPGLSDIKGKRREPMSRRGVERWLRVGLRHCGPRSHSPGECAWAPAPGAAPGAWRPPARAARSASTPGRIAPFMAGGSQRDGGGRCAFAAATRIAERFARRGLRSAVISRVRRGPGLRRESWTALVACGRRSALPSRV